MPAVKLPIIPLKYIVGIDIAKDSFVACLGYLEVGQQLHFGKEVTFDNTASGFTDLLRWVAKHQASAIPRWFVVEATGVYYEELAYFMADNQQLLSILSPNKVKHFARSTELKSKTDHLMRACAAASAWNAFCRLGNRPPRPCVNCGPWPASAKYSPGKGPNSRRVPTLTRTATSRIVEPWPG